MKFIDLQEQYRIQRDEIDRRLAAVLEHGQYIMGPEVAQLEEQLLNWVGTKNCITVSSGTDALLMSLMALEVGQGDEVITTPFSFAATLEVIIRLQATPVLVDVEKETGNIDARLISKAITEKTKAIIPVSLYGQPSDMDPINEAARDKGIVVIEDAAQSFGSEYKGRKSCNLSSIGCTSFFPSKPLGCFGDGGAIFTNDDALANTLREIRLHGQDGRYNHVRLGVGGRMDTLQCAVLLAKMEKFASEIERRQFLGKKYSEVIKKSSKNILPLVVKENRTSVFGQYTLTLDNRASVVRALQSEGIPSAVHYPLGLHQQPAFARIFEGKSYPVTEDLAQRVLSLPMHPYLREDELNKVVSTILKTLNK